MSRASGTACVHTRSGVWQEVWICSRETYFMPHYLKTRESFWTFIAVPCFRGTAMGLSQSGPELLGKTYLASEDEWVTKLRGRRLLKPQGIVSLSYLNSHKLFSSRWSVWGPKFIACVYLTQLKSQGKKTWKRKKKGGNRQQLTMPKLLLIWIYVESESFTLILLSTPLFGSVST